MKIVKVNIVIFDGLVYDVDIEMVSVRVESGDFGILSGYILIVVFFKIGVVCLKKDGQIELVVVSGGFVEVCFDQVIIFVQVVEIVEGIDKECVVVVCQWVQECLNF